MKRVKQEELIQTISKAVAMYGLLHAHAQGKTDLTEDQLANVVTGLSLEARDVLRRVRGQRLPDDGGAWVIEAQRRACSPRRRLHS